MRKRIEKQLTYPEGCKKWIMQEMLNKIKGNHPYLSFFEDGSFDFYQENLDDALAKSKDCTQFSKRFFELCKVIKNENGITLYQATSPALTGINGLCEWEEGYDEELHDLYFAVRNFWCDDTFIVCDDTGYCLGKMGRDTSRVSKVIKFV